MHIFIEEITKFNTFFSTYNPCNVRTHLFCAPIKLYLTVFLYAKVVFVSMSHNFYIIKIMFKHQFIFIDYGVFG
jgi:hypothetical protein